MRSVHVGRRDLTGLSSVDAMVCVVEVSKQYSVTINESNGLGLSE